MPWLFLVLSALGALSVANALWPLRRPWWLKLPSFNLGWGVNELPLHALAGNAFVVAIFTSLGALEDRPGRVAVALTAVSSVGLVVLAAAHFRAGAAVDAGIREALGDDDPLIGDLDERAASPLPRSWFVLPWLAWWRTPAVERVRNVVYT